MLPSELLRELHESYLCIKAIAEAARQLEMRLSHIVQPELAAARQLNDEAQKDFDECAEDWTRR